MTGRKGTREPQACHWTADGHFLRTHLRSCTTGCEGCEPCHERHCQGRPARNGHGPSCEAHIPGGTVACELCKGKARHAVETISDLSALLLPAAIMSGSVTGEAAVLAGPAPDPYTRREHDRELRAWGLWGWLEDDDPWHPFAVLGRWAMATAETLELPPVAVHTVTAYAGHILEHLDEIAGHERHGFPRMLAELRACRRHLENVLRNSHEPETGVPCPSCSTPDQPGPRLEHVHVDEDPTGASDGWRCPRCRKWWREADYRLRVGRDARQHATRLTAAAITDLYRVPAGTLRRWAHEGRVKKYGRDSTGKQLYSVPDVLRCREETRAGGSASPAADGA